MQRTEESRAGGVEQRNQGAEILSEVEQTLNHVRPRGKDTSPPGGYGRNEIACRAFDSTGRNVHENMYRAFADRSRMKKILARTAGILPQREQMVLSRYYCDELNFKETGDVLGIRPCCASRLFKRAVLDLMSQSENVRGE